MCDIFLYSTGQKERKFTAAFQTTVTPLFFFFFLKQCFFLKEDLYITEYPLIVTSQLEFSFAQYINVFVAWEPPPLGNLLGSKHWQERDEYPNF